MIGIVGDLTGGYSMRLDPAPLCLRNDGGTLCRLIRPVDAFANHLTCDVCGDMYTAELLEAVIKSSWEALRLGYMPSEYRLYGNVRLSVAFREHGPVTTETIVEYRSG